MATITKRKWATSKGEPREAWVLAFTDASGKRHKEQFTKKRDADARRVEVEGEVRRGAFRPEAREKTVADVVDLYTKHLKARHLRDAHVTKTYLNSVTAELERYVLAKKYDEESAALRKRAVNFDKGIGQVRLAQLTSSRIGDLRDDLLEAGVSVATTRRAISSLSRALGYAIEKDWLAVNPAKGVRTIGRRDEGSRKVEPPSPAALKALIDNATPTMRLRLLFAASTGLRASEQWALQWKHVDLEKARVKVEQRVDVFGVVDTTKSRAGLRDVPLGKGIVKEMKAARPENSGPDDLVFPAAEGRHIRHGNFLKREFDPLVKKAKQSGFTWHGLRHFAISQWIAADLNPKTVQTYAGHATLAITMDRYGHLFPSPDHSDAMDRIAEGLLG